MKHAFVAVHKLTEAELERLCCEHDFIKENDPENDILYGRPPGSSERVPEAANIKEEVPDAELESITVKEEPIDWHHERQTDQESLSSSTACKSEMKVAAADAQVAEQETDGNLKNEDSGTSDPSFELLVRCSTPTEGTKPPLVMGENCVLKRLHSSQHKVEQQQQCDLCDFFRFKTTTLKQFLHAKKVVDEPYICESNPCSSKQNNDIHFQQADECRISSLFRCDLCDYSCAHNGDLKVHKAGKHGIGKLYTCDLCEYSSVRKGNLKVHKAGKHGLGKLYTCDLCDYSTALNGNLKPHKASKHGMGKLYTCDLCDYSTALYGNLKLHKDGKHGMGKLYTCTLCDYSSAHSGHLKRHNAGKHGMGKLYTCDLCDYSSAQNGNLKIHKAFKHGMGKLYMCDLCDYSSAGNGNLKVHKARKHGMVKLHT